MTATILAAPPWHWWLGVFWFVVDVIILIGLAILYRVMVPSAGRRRRTARPRGSR